MLLLLLLDPAAAMTARDPSRQSIRPDFAAQGALLGSHLVISTMLLSLQFCTIVFIPYPFSTLLAEGERASTATERRAGRPRDRFATSAATQAGGDNKGATENKAMQCTQADSIAATVSESASVSLACWMALT